MSNLPQIILTASDEVILKKKTAWAEVGQLVHDTNLKLANDAKIIINKLVLPKTTSDIINAESILKEVSTDLVLLIDSRKKITSKFDKVTSGLMEFEKSIKEPVEQFKKAIILLKKAEEERIRKENEEVEKRKIIYERYVSIINESYVEMKNKVAEICSKSYEHALGKGNVTIENLPAYLDKVKTKLTLNDFKLPELPTLDEELWRKAYDSVDMAPPELMLNYFHQQLKLKFEFYNVAVKNKEAAIEAEKERENAAKTERENELANAKVAARLETISTSGAEIKSDIKELKKKYEVDLEDSEQCALLIITAFVTNFKMVKDGIRVKSLLKLSVEQMADAISWYKNKDERFEVTGIKFKVIEKL